MQMGTLRIFCDIALTQSFTDAARLHGCTPAHASQSFHAMETELGHAAGRTIPPPDPAQRRRASSATPSASN
jgi:hypothetical protein